MLPLVHFRNNPWNKSYTRICNWISSGTAIVPWYFTIQLKNPTSSLFIRIKMASEAQWFRFQAWVTLFSVSSVQSLSRIWHFATLWTAAHQASLSITNSQSLPKPMSIESVMPSNRLILCHPLLLPPSIFLSIRVFSKESVLCIRWPKYWRFSFNISPSNEYSGLISLRMDWLDLLTVLGLSRVFSNTTAPKHQFFGTQHSL